MQKRRLGASDLEITPIGVGAWAMGGGGWQFAWGAQDDDESVDAIHAALDQGINWIDTAAIYGLGHSEEVVGRALAGRSQETAGLHQVRDRLGRAPRDATDALSPNRSARKWSRACSRLKLDVIDLYQIHWPEPDNLVEAAWTMMAKLQQAGQGEVHRRVELQRGPDAARAGDCAHHVAAAAVFDHFAGDREGDLAFHAGEQYRRDRLLADEVRDCSAAP